MSFHDRIEAARQAIHRAERSRVSEPDVDRAARRRIADERRARDELRLAHDVHAVPMTAPRIEGASA